MHMRTASFTLMLVAGVMFAPSPAKAQCGYCVEYPMASLHKAPEEGSGTYVTNGHEFLEDGVCAGYHGHSNCNFNEEEMALLGSLTQGEDVEMPAVRALLSRHAPRISVLASQAGFEMSACGDPQDISFVPLPDELWQVLVDEAPLAR